MLAYRSPPCFMSTPRARFWRGLDRLVGLWRSEGPLAEMMGAEEINCGSADGDGDGSVEFEEAATSFCLGTAGIEEHEGEARHGDERRKRVERNAEGTGKIGAADAKQDDADLLQGELEEDARDDEHGDDLRQREETEESADEAEGD